MARNEEKSQSMLFRFREAQAAELGLSGRTDRRPRVASTCKDLRQCERWRGEILREISRKVSKIQDDGLTDYEVRDLNDEINKLLREKHHWENQIIALGGANYKRAAGKMLDGEGKEVPGARGYKYFGRAKDLPGVKELFQSHAATVAEQESFKTIKPNMFANLGPDYYGDMDEGDGDLLEFESKAEAEAWAESLADLTETHGLALDDPPPLPTPSWVSLDAPSTSAVPIPDDVEMAPAVEEAAPAAPGGKRKAASASAAAKKVKLDKAALVAEQEATKVREAEAEEEKKRGNGFLSVLKEGDLRPPTLLSFQEIEKYIVAEQKKALLAEYGA